MRSARLKAGRGSVSIARKVDRAGVKPCRAHQRQEAHLLGRVVLESR